MQSYIRDHAEYDLHSDVVAIAIEDLPVNAADCGCMGDADSEWKDEGSQVE